MAEATRLTTNPSPGTAGEPSGPTAVLVEAPDPEQGPSQGPTPVSTKSSGAIGVKQVVSKKPSVQIREPPRATRQVSSGMYGGYSVVKVEEKHGPLHNAIPVMPVPLAIICCILNIIAPGIGTLISAPTVFCCGPTRIGRPLVAFGLNLLSSLGQMLTFLLIVGWIWSILWGMTFVTLALSCKQSAMPSPVPYYVRRQSSVE